MKNLSPQKTALTLGVFVGGVHVVWSLLILLGWAQPLLDFIFWAHMIANPYQVMSFDVTACLTLIVVTFCVGYGIGWIFATLWNILHRK